MRIREPRWSRFTRAAVSGADFHEESPTGVDPVGNAGSGAAEAPVPKSMGRLRQQVGVFRRRLAATSQGRPERAEQQRPDVRLLPSVVAVWAMAAAAIAWPVSTVQTVSVVLGATLLGATGTAFTWLRSRRYLRRHSQRRQEQGYLLQGRRVQGSRHQLPAGAGATALLACISLLGVLLAVGLHNASMGSSQLELAVTQGEEMALTLEVATPPRQLEGGNGPPRVLFDAFVVHATVRGRMLSGRLPIRVMAGAAWAGLQPGEKAWTAGKITVAEASDRVVGILHPGTDPVAGSALHYNAETSNAEPSRVGTDKGGENGTQAVVTSMRKAWQGSVEAVWASSSPDTAGLLPGMVMGERSGMGSGLNDAMKTVGLTHLTAVSGANCTLVLASLMLVLRSLHAPRMVAFAVSGSGLVGFVVLVGPDPSVLRAAVMGAIGAMAMLGGRPKRTGALLSVSVIVLLVADPWLSVDYAFILSVLATVGLHLVGRRCAQWLSVLLPLWLAQAVAIPLAAQLFCAPVIVLLQARLTPYAVAANMAAAPVVALVTTVGTLGLVAASVLPPLAALCAAVSGAGAWWVAVVARWMSALPAASLPWPGGVQGVVLMACLNVALLGGLYAVVERDRTAKAAAAVLERIPAWWRVRFGFAAVAVLGAAVAGWWTKAFLSG